MEGHDLDQRLLKALRHPLRQALLRRFLEEEEALSPVALARLEGKPLPNVSYHVRELQRQGAIELVGDRQVRGSVEHFYRAVWVQSVLCPRNR